MSKQAECEIWLREVSRQRPKAADVATLVALVAELASLLAEDAEGVRSEGRQVNACLRCGQIARWATDCPLPSAKRARDDGHSSSSLQGVEFDASTDDAWSVPFEERCVKVATALGHLRRFLLPGSTALLDNGATSLMCGHLTLERYSHEFKAAGFVEELRTLTCALLACGLEM